MLKIVTVNVNPNDLPPLYCLTGAGPSPWGNYQSVNCGCEEDLRPMVLEMWDGTSTPFTVQCSCGNVYELTLTVEIDAEMRFQGWERRTK